MGGGHNSYEGCSRYNPEEYDGGGILCRRGLSRRLRHVAVFIVGDCLEGSAMWCMLMEYCAGGGLCHMLRHTGPRSEGLGASVLHSLLSALAYIHSKEVVHRDVKGENVVIGSGPRFVLSDFSIATHLSDKNSLRRRCGSPGHVAPEILMREPCCRRSDIFSLGVVMHLVLVGRLPFATGVEKTRRQPFFS